MAKGGFKGGNDSVDNDQKRKWDRSLRGLSGSSSVSSMDEDSPSEDELCTKLIRLATELRELRSKRKTGRATQFRIYKKKLKLLRRKVASALRAKSFQDVQNMRQSFEEGIVQDTKNKALRHELAGLMDEVYEGTEDAFGVLEASVAAHMREATEASERYWGSRRKEGVSRTEGGPLRESTS
ncbi:hypothetical protein CFIMG_004634RA [Ceratocystis fimbriata CBS 114723]|uniref:Uncharacterized protein n=1 Tax=Ceratocystis fimbriata CBS 114723 TaxID=1035309 RepID=A0A2C5WZ10_9PEZI|nr:hypothetical protein CFIMG_004634RA [Ceratocystis fimbriata CBS 114723]